MVAQEVAERPASQIVLVGKPAAAHELSICRPSWSGISWRSALGSAVSVEEPVEKYMAKANHVRQRVAILACASLLCLGAAAPFDPFAGPKPLLVWRGRGRRQEDGGLLPLRLPRRAGVEQGVPGRGAASRPCPGSLSQIGRRPALGERARRFALLREGRRMRRRRLSPPRGGLREPRGRLPMLRSRREFLRPRLRMLRARLRLLGIRLHPLLLRRRALSVRRRSIRVRRRRLRARRDIVRAPLQAVAARLVRCAFVFMP
jgi:hypothetical protein